MDCKIRVSDTAIAGVKIIEPRVFEDARGYFTETFSAREFRDKVADVEFVQDNESKSSYGVVRGLHFQRPPYTQAKLVRCTLGRVLDVAVDLRRSSPTYGQHIAVELSAENHRQLFVPEGFAHGFAVLSDTAVFQYKCTEYYHPESEGGVDMRSDELNIKWGIDFDSAILSGKDTRYPDFKDFESPFE